MESDLPPPQAIGLSGTGQLEQAQDRTDNLGDHRSRRRAAYAAAQSGDEHQVQHQVDQGGNDQIVQGVAAVAHRL